MLLFINSMGHVYSRDELYKMTINEALKSHNNDPILKSLAESKASTYQHNIKNNEGHEFKYIPNSPQYYGCNIMTLFEPDSEYKRFKYELCKTINNIPNYIKETKGLTSNINILGRHKNDNGKACYQMEQFCWRFQTDNRCDLTINIDTYTDHYTKISDDGKQYEKIKLPKYPNRCSIIVDWTIVNWRDAKFYY